MSMLDETNYGVHLTKNVGSFLNPQFKKTPDWFDPEYLPSGRGPLFWVQGEDPYRRTQMAVQVGLSLKGVLGVPVHYWTEEDWLFQRQQVWIFQKTAFKTGDDASFVQYANFEQEFHDRQAVEAMIFDHLAAQSSYGYGAIDDLSRMLWDRTMVMEKPTVLSGSPDRVSRYIKNETLLSLLERSTKVVTPE